MQSTNSKIFGEVKVLLKDFGILSKKLGSGVGYKHKINGDYETLRLIRFIFSEILSIKVEDQPFEKINWIIFFSYKDLYHCSISHEKFGFKIYIHNGNDEEFSKRIGEEIENIVSKALILIIPKIEELAKAALLEGRIIVNNRFSELFRPYDYFRRMSILRKKTEQKARTLSPSKKTRKVALWRSLSNYRYYEDSTYFYFFSLLEHLCVLFLGYRKIEERYDVAKFTNLKWSDKFKLVFDLKESEFKKIYDDLIVLARYRRNPVAHGFSKIVFNFYLEGARHKISCVLSDKDVITEWHKSLEKFNVTDSFLKLLETHSSTKNIFKYLVHDFNVSFEKEALAVNDSIVEMNEEELDEYIEYMSQIYDNSANMDW